MFDNTPCPKFAKSPSYFKEFNPLLEVAICFIEHQSTILLLQRSPNSIQGGRWCVPGGKLNPGEFVEEAILRELHEELGWSITNSDLEFKVKLFERFPPFGDFILNVFSFPLSTPPLPVRLSPQEHTNYLWATHEQFFSIDLMVGQKEVYNYLYYGESP